MSSKVVRVGWLCFSIVLGGVLLWHLAVLEEVVEGVSGAREQAADAVALVPAREGVSDVTVATPPPAREELAAAPRAPEIPVAPDPDETRVRARFVDERGAPIGGVELLLVGAPERIVRSAVDGSATLALATPAGPRWWTFEARCAGFALERRSASSEQGGETLLLGDWILLAGGAVEGRVVDEEGRGLAGAEVACRGEEIPAREWEWKRRRALRELWRPGASATTESDGSFGLLDVPAGRIRLVVAAEERPAAVSGDVDVPAGGLARGVEIAMEAADGGTLIAGIVLDPKGHPVPGAPVTIRSAGATTRLFTDEDGRFLQRCGDQEPHDVTATDPGLRHREATRLGVRPGTTDLVLRLEKAPGIALVVRSATDEPVERFAVAVIAERGSTPLAFLQEDERPGGALVLAAPGEDFRVEVRANGWVPARLGPFSARPPPERIECRLDPAGGIAGRIVSGTEPVGGARVALHEAARTRVTYNGFPLRMRPAPACETESDGGGEFSLSVERAGSYYLRVDADGHAPAELGPLALAPDARREEEIALDQGGTLVVQVRSASGASVAGKLVALSRGDGRGRTERADEEGTLVLARLTPGAWQVAVAAEEIDPDSGATYESELPAGELPHHCRVRAGETTEIDLWLEEQGMERCRLAGRLTIDGRPAEGWSAQLDRARQPLGAPQTFVAPGVFRVGADEPGSYRLRLTGGGAEPGAMLVLLETIELLEGERSWSLALESATLEGTLGPALAPDAFLFWRWQRGALECIVPIVPDSEHRFRCPRVPAGRGALVRCDPARPLEEQTPEVLRELTLEAGQTATLEL